MNKKLLFAAMSFAALTACSTDDFESKQQVAEGVSPIQFEVINNDGDITRASMDGNKVVWNANDGDLFTLYHGGAVSGTYLSGVQNATFTAQAGGDGEPATLTTPSMIMEGSAIMVWPVDTTFRVTTGNLSILIPANQTDDIENHIPYVSDIVNIKKRVSTATPAEYAIGADNTAGYNRKYPVFMRPMASQLIVKADYAGTESVLAPLSTGDDAIEPIKVTSVELNSSSKKFTTEIALAFQTADEFNTANSLTGDNTIQKQWGNAVKNNAWSHVTGFATTATNSVETLTTKCLTGNESSKFLILPQSDVNFVESEAAVVVNTIYGKVSVKKATYGDDFAKAWYRYISASTDISATGETKADAAETSGENAGKFKAYAGVHTGLKQTIGGFNKYIATKGVAKGEPVGASATRYVKVLLTKLDMQGLHVKNDKHLYDAVRVWKEIGAKNTDITVYLDGDKDGNFEISKKTIAKINEINAATAAEKRSFKVMPCKDDECKTIVITGGDEMPQDLTFIVANGTTKVPVALNAGENWKWNSKNVMVDAAANTGVSKIINRGTLVSGANATLKIFEYNYANPKKPNQVNIEFENDGEWNITAGTLNVQFTVTNNGKVNIAKGAQYRQDGIGNNFTNEAATLPERFFTADQKKKNVKEQIGVVYNSGVFATVNDAEINNYGLIEHLEKDAKTYITSNQKGTGFDAAFDKSSNKMGRINLPFDNKDEDNISIKGDAKQGFVSVTVTSDNASSKQLDASKVGTYVNYVIINSGIEEITNVNNQVQYIEFNDKDKKEIAWLPRFNKDGSIIPYPYTGLIVLSPVNIKLKTTVNVSGSTYIAADMYVGGTFTYGTYDGYFGNTAKNAETMYITY